MVKGGCVFFAIERFCVIDFLTDKFFIFFGVHFLVKSKQFIEDVLLEGVLLVKGPVPGSKNTLVKLVKEA